LAEDEYSTGLVATVRALVTDVVGPAALEGIDDDAPLFEGMVLDSLHLVAIVSELEQRFGITISPEDLVPDNFGSLSKMAHFVEVRR
jgi:acyl carrier protein